MHKKLIASILTLVFSGTLFAAEPLSADALNSLLLNNTMHGKNLQHDREFTNYFRDDGSVTKITSTGTIKHGKWHVTDKGEHCGDWGRGERCNLVVDLGNGRYQKIDKDKPRIEFTVIKGNPNNL